MSYCLRFLEKHNNDVEALKKDLEIRGAAYFPLTLSKTEADRYMQDSKNSMVKYFLILTMVTLHDEFDFEKDDLKRFRDRMELKAECLSWDWTTWDDQIQILADECGIDFRSDE